MDTFAGLSCSFVLFAEPGRLSVDRVEHVANFGVGSRKLVVRAVFHTFSTMHTFAAIEAVVGADNVTVAPSVTVAAGVAVAEVTEVAGVEEKDWASLNMERMLSVTGNAGRACDRTCDEAQRWASL